MDFLIGHLIGDYILQNDWMAKNKKKPYWAGDVPCFAHCLTYTLAVMVCTGWLWRPWISPMSPSILSTPYGLFFLVFLSHWLFDRSNICMWWMRFTKKTLPDGAHITPDTLFFPLVYVGVDNTCHLVCLWLTQKFIIGA